MGVDGSSNRGEMTAGSRELLDAVRRNRRLAKDFEATVASATAFLYAASVLLLTRRLARSL
jgi:hypothetical protein